MSQAILELKHSRLRSGVRLEITGSKSESNRALILQALYPNLRLENLSNADDTQLLKRALLSDASLIDIHHAGTAMRFLTAYLSTQNGGSYRLTGSARMKERPVGVLVEALKALGADINYVENNGYPPLDINGTALKGDYVELKAGVSSQYISALLLIAASLKQGLKLRLLGSITSRPYIEMTLSLLNRVGIRTEFTQDTIKVYPFGGLQGEPIITIESDWSSASYFYSLIALSDLNTEIHLSHYFKNSLQGDSVLQSIYEFFGVSTNFTDQGIALKKVTLAKEQRLELDLADAPDIAQTIAVSCFGLGISCHLTGLHTLKIKETDRLEALKMELSKLGASLAVSDDSLTLEGSSHAFRQDQSIRTYNDHRMAMAFAPLVLKGSIFIEDPEVVSKSYPDFWTDMKTLGVEMK
jgi:3-phosphoshikimate 1-carboxyvinyltransferase